VTDKIKVREAAWEYNKKGAFHFLSTPPSPPTQRCHQKFEGLDSCHLGGGGRGEGEECG